jgi:hypothetical protein
MYKDVEENLASQRKEKFDGKDKWVGGLPVGLELAAGRIVGRS